MQIVLSKSVLRPLLITDASSLANHANNPKIAENVRDIFPHPYEIEDAEFFIKNIASDPKNLIMAIEVDKEAVGVIGIHPQSDVYRGSAELGYWLGERYWGRGIVTEAVKAMASYSFEKLNIHRIYAKVFEKNLASVRVLEKSGFVREAILRKAVIKQNVILDEYVYAKLLT